MNVAETPLLDGTDVVLNIVMTMKRFVTRVLKDFIHMIQE